MTDNGATRRTGTGALAAAVGAASGAIAAGALALPLGQATATLLARRGPLAEADAEALVLVWMLAGALLGGLWGCYGALRSANERGAGRTLLLLALVAPLALVALGGMGRAVTPSFAVLLLAPALTVAVLAALTRRLDPGVAARG